jgi:hypothetical protein
MTDASRHQPCEPPPEDINFVRAVREMQQQQVIADLCVVPRCPRCRTPLRARVTCTGPAYTCHCEEYRFP